MRTTAEQGTFRFSDINPHSGVEYARSRYGDLPEFVMAVIDDRIGVVGLAWDQLVEDGEVYEHIRRGESFPVRGRTRPGFLTRSVCHGCHGSGRVHVSMAVGYKVCGVCEGQRWRPVRTEAEYAELVSQARVTESRCAA